MARRQKTQFSADKLLDRISLLPWWAAVLLALGAFALFNSVPTSNADALVELARYAFPLILLMVALVSTLRRRQRETSSTGGAAGTRSLDRMAVDEFEALLGEAFRLQGYQTVDNVGGGASGRVDMVLRRERETFLVLFKHWKESRIDVDVVQQLQRTMTARGAIGGFVVTLGRFSRESTAFAAGCNVRLIDGPVLQGMAERVQATRTRALATAS